MNIIIEFAAWLVSLTMLATAAATAQPLRPLSISLASTSFATAAPRIAKELGLYEKHGIAPTFVIMENANAATTALISNSVEAAVSGPGELVIAQARGQKVVVIANVYAGLSGTVVLSKAAAEKSGVAPNAPPSQRLKALDGLVIASPSATGAYTVALKSAAKEAGANIRFTYMALPAMPAALESGAIQGFVAGAPFWGFPVTKGTGILWLNGPKGELPRDSMPASSGNVQTMRDFAEANPNLIRNLAAVFADLAKAIDERPAEVRAAVAKLYPDLDPQTLDLLFSSESMAWKAGPPTVQDIAHEIAFVKSIGTPIPHIDSLDPASMIFR